jgi:hypothetical protein
MAALSTVIAVAAFTISAVSAAYQVVQAKKAASKAEEAAEARRGFELVLEGEASDLPLAYGRNLIGGVRVWHATSTDFRHTTTNADNVFQTGADGVPGRTISYEGWVNIPSPIVNAIMQQFNTDIGALDSGYLSSSQSGTANEYLFFQQALCAGPINGVIDVVVDGSRYLDDPSLGSFGQSESDKRTRVKAAMRVDCHYGNTAVADNIAKNNFAERKDAVFQDMAYASTVVRIDRDDPQFSNVPNLQFIVEGRKVPDVVSGAFVATKSYSTNPARCLLDYLTDTVLGKGISLSEIDLPSFEAGKVVCNTIVQEGVIVGGKYYQPTNKSRNITNINIPLYECNILLDPKKPARDNIESILSTMGDARLVWSAGKYRLNLQYPTVLSSLEIAETLNDDNLVLDQEVQISWPTASERLNNCRVRFSNEFEGFKEDSVSWPPKVTASFAKGVGGTRYPNVTDSFDDARPGGRLLNSLGVWDGTSNTTSLTWLMQVSGDKAGSYTVSYTGDDTSNVTIVETKLPGADVQVFSSSHNDWRSVKTGTITLGQASVTKYYRITANVTNTGGKKGFAIRLENATNVLWTSREPTYSDFVQYDYSSAVYDAMLLEDGNLDLPSEVFAEGVTDPYHALAKAEELVRTSRSAFTITLKYNTTDTLLEPGDFIQLSSETLKLGLDVPLYFRVSSAKLDENRVCEVTASRFELSQLAWNVKDDAYVNVPAIYNNRILEPSELVYNPPVDSNIESSGSLTWGTPPGYEVAGYVVYMHNPMVDGLDSQLQPVYSEVGRSRNTSFELPKINAASALFGVRALGINGRMSVMTTISNTSATRLSHNWLQGLNISSTALGFYRPKTDLVVVPASITLTANAVNIVRPLYTWYVDGVLINGANVHTLVILKPTLSSTNKTYSVVVQASSILGVPEGPTYEASKLLTYIEEGVDAGAIQTSATRNTFTLSSVGELLPSQSSVSVRVMTQNVGGVTWTIKDAAGTALPAGAYLLPNGLTEVSISPSAFMLASGATDGVVITATAIKYGQELFSSVTILKVRNGSEALTAFLTNESHTVPCDSSGNPLSYVGANGQFKVYHGAEDVTNNCTFVRINDYGVNSVINVGGVKGAYLVDVIGVDVGYATFRATYNPGNGAITVDKTFSVVKSKAGFSPPLITLNTDKQTVGYSAAGLLLPSQLVTFTAVRLNSTEAVEWHLRDFNGNFRIGFLSVSGLTATLTAANFEAARNGTAGVIAQVVMGSLSDSSSILRVQDGANALTAYLTNEAHVLPADSAGNVGTYTGASGAFRVYYGTSDVTNACTFEKGAELNVVGAIAPNGGYNVSQMVLAATSGSVKFTASYNPGNGLMTVEKEFSLTKSKSGINAKSLTIASDKQTLRYAADDTPLPLQSVSFSTQLSNISGTVVWTISDFGGNASSGLSVAGGTATLSEANFATARNSTTGVIVKAALTFEGVEYSDQISVIRLRDGTNSLTAFLTNEAHTIPCDSSGTPLSYAGASGQFKVFYGTSDVTNDCTFSRIGDNGARSVVDVNNVKGAYLVDLVSIPVSSATFRATYNVPGVGSINIDRVFSLTKSNAGVNAKSISLTSNRQVITYNATDVIVGGQDTTFTVQKSNTTDAVTWYMEDFAGAEVGGQLQVNGDTATLSGAQFDVSRRGTSGVIVRASVVGAGSDSISIVKVRDGTIGTNGLAAISVTKSKSTIAIPADTNGLNAVFTSSGYDLVVREGSEIIKFSTGVNTATVVPGYWFLNGYYGFNEVDVPADRFVDTGDALSVGNLAAMPGNVGRLNIGIYGKRFDGTPFYVESLQTYTKVLGGYIDFTPPSVPIFTGDPTYAVITLASGNTVVNATVAWTTPANGAADLDYYELGVKLTTSATYSYVQTSANSHTFPILPNRTYDYSVRAIDKNQNKSGFGYLYSRTSGRDESIPGAPTGLTATSSIRNIYLKWTNTLSDDLAKVEVREAVRPIGAVYDIPYNLIATVNGSPGQTGGYTRGSIDPAMEYYYVVESIDSSGNRSGWSQYFGPVVSSKLVDDDVTAGTLNADRLRSNTSLPGSLLISNQGFDLNTLGGWSSNPAARINNGPTTRIDPGKIQITGEFSLANWKAGPNSTEINGGNIAASSIRTQSLDVGNRGIEQVGLVFEVVYSNGAPTNQVVWTSGNFIYIDDNGNPAAPPGGVSAGTATWVGGVLYFYWPRDSSAILTTTAAGIAYGPNNIVLGTYTGAIGLIMTYGKTKVSGDEITVDSLHGNRIRANTILADRIDTRNLTIKDAAGNVAFSASGGLDFSYLRNVNIVNANIQNLTIGTDKLALNSVSEIDAATLPAMVAGNGANQDVINYVLTVQRPCKLIVMITGGQSYLSGPGIWNVQAVIDSTVIGNTGGAGAISDTISLTSYWNFEGAGSYTIRMRWFGYNNTLRLANATMVVMAVYR